MPEIPSFGDALRLLGTTVGIGAVVSFLLSQMDRFQGVGPQAKFWIVLIVSLVLPVAATAVVQLVPAETLKALEPYWQALSAGFLVFLGTQGMYALLKSKKAAS